MPFPRRFSASVATLLSLVLVSSLTTAAPLLGDGGGQDPLAGLEWRNVGPVNMSGRVADVEGVPGDAKVLYVGAASGGIWKSTDGGTTFEPIFDDQPTASIGDVALAPSNPEVVWVGSGEANTRNSVSFGNGVYRSTDGGETWKHLGLEATRHVSRIAVDPHDPDRAWVAAVGNIYEPGPERGVYRTTDGGETWEKVLYLDEHHGAADLDLDPSNPNVLFATLWRFERKPWKFTSGGEEGGVYRSTDGGETWEKLTKGLPQAMGRIGVKIAPSEPEVVYVIAESNDGTLFRSEDRGESFERVSDDVTIVSRGFYYTDLRVDPSDANTVWAVASQLQRSIDGGRTWERIAPSIHIDFHALWIDPLNPRRIWLGQDGGIAVSHDGGGTWNAPRNLPIAQFYQVFHDDLEPFYRLGGGLQDNGTWIGPSRTREGAGILPDLWRMMSFGDAYFVVPHPENPDLFLSEYQAGGIVRTNIETGRQWHVSPQPRRNDGGPAGELEYRFNWNSPIVASPHDPQTVYFAGNVVFKTRDFGTTWDAVSPDLTTDDPEKQGLGGGPIWPENTTAEYHTTIISFAESPVEAGVLWAGTDDGNLQISRDAGESWSNVIANVHDLPAFSPVSHVEPSRKAAGTAYAAFDRHMFGDFRPHLFKTADHGATWRRLGDEGLPEEGWVWVVREDPKNPNLLYAGTEVGLWASWNGGESWRRLHLGNLPTVAVHDLLIHPRANDLIVGTHGRAIWVFDDATPIQRWSEEIARKPAHLFPIRPALHFTKTFSRYGLGDAVWLAPNPPDGALLTYHLAESLEPAEELDEEELAAALEKARERLTIEVFDDAGELVRELEELPLGAGLHRVAWDLRYDPPAKRAGDEGGGSDFQQPPRGPRVLPGLYTVRLTLDGEIQEKRVDVRVDPEVEVGRRELEAALTVGLALREMRSGINRGLDALETIEAQIGERRATAKTLGRELPEGLVESLEGFGEKLVEILGRFVKDDEKPFWSQGPQLAQRVDSLFNNLDGALDAPTAAQLEHFEELEAEFEAATGRVDQLLNEDLPALNSELEAAGIAPVMAPDRE